MAPACSREDIAYPVLDKVGRCVATIFANCSRCASEKYRQLLQTDAKLMKDTRVMVSVCENGFKDLGGDVLVEVNLRTSRCIHSLTER